MHLNEMKNVLWIHDLHFYTENRKVVGASQPAASGWIIAFQCAAENEKCVFVTASHEAPGAFGFFRDEK